MKAARIGIISLKHRQIILKSKIKDVSNQLKIFNIKSIWDLKKLYLRPQHFWRIRILMLLRKQIIKNRYKQNQIIVSQRISRPLRISFIPEMQDYTDICNKKHKIGHIKISMVELAAFLLKKTWDPTFSITIISIWWNQLTLNKNNRI